MELAGLQGQLDTLNGALGEYDRRVHGDRVGRWLVTYSCKRFWPEDPRPEDIDIKDIAHALSLINRYNGHTPQGYSVAQHAVLVSQIVPRRYAKLGLHHDDGEAYLGDVISPIKRLIRELYEPIEEKVMRAVALRLGFLDEFDCPAARRRVKEADLVLLATETRDLKPSQISTRPLTELPMDAHIDECWPAERAEKEFLARFEELHGRYAI